MSDAIIGIDLGTTAYSSAYYLGGIVQALEEAGAERTPCYVCYKFMFQAEPEVGLDAQRIEKVNPRCFTVYGNILLKSRNFK